MATQTTAGPEVAATKVSREKPRRPAPFESKQQMLDVNDVSDLCRVSTRTIDRLMDQASEEAKALEHPFPKPIRIGNKRLWTRAAIETWARRMDEHANPGLVA